MSAAFAIGVVALAVSCDQGEPTDRVERLAPLHLISANIGKDRPLAANADIELVFDRLLLPITLTRQSFVLVDAYNSTQFPVVRYDPLRRKLTFANPEPREEEWLTPGQPYRVVLPIPQGRNVVGGVRAFDGATLEATSPRQIGFFTTPATNDRPKSLTNYCREIQPLFQTKCTRCHGGPSPEAGLDLASGRALETTAFNRNAHSSMHGALTSSATLPDLHFGSDMPIIDPGSPGTSYLIYKLLVDPEEGSPMNGACGSVAPRSPWNLPEDERSRLRERIVGHMVGITQLSKDEMAALSEWIADGAEVAECGACAKK